MDSAVKQKLVGRVGITFSENVYVFDQLEEPVELDGYVGRMDIKTDFGGPLILALTTENGGLLIDGNRIEIYISPTQTENIEPGSYRYDLEVEAPTGDVIGILYGSFRVKDSITHPDA